MSRSTIVKDALARFPELPLRAIARYILQNFGPQFDNDLEKIRSSVRYHVGANGEYSRQFRLDPRTKTVKMPETWRKTRVPHKLSPGLWLVMADIHIPFHEPKPLEAAMQYGKNAGVTGVLLAGDVQDCAAVSYWPSAIKRDFDKEVTLFVDFLDLLRREFPKQEIVYLPGNHEYRLPRYYESRVPELIGLPLAAFETVLGLEARNIELLDFRQMVLAGKLPIFHGDEFRLSRAVNVARGLFLKTKSYSLCAHGHSSSEHTERNIHGTILTTWSIGCLCDLSPDYAPHSNWNWGACLISIEPNGQFEVLNRRILPNMDVV
jgi:predicted phosphodiesterase